MSDCDRMPVQVYFRPLEDLARPWFDEAQVERFILAIILCFLYGQISIEVWFFNSLWLASDIEFTSLEHGEAFHRAAFRSHSINGENSFEDLLFRANLFKFLHIFVTLVIWLPMHFC